MKKVLKIIGLGFVALIVLSALTQRSGSGNTSASPASTSTGTQTARPTPSPRRLVVKAGTLIQQYDANKLAAQQRYTGKLIETTGRISNITSSAGQPYIALDPLLDGPFTMTSLTCDFDSVTPLLRLVKGQQVTVRGTMQDMFMTVISMEHCTLVRVGR